MSGVVPENSMNLEVAVAENSPPAGESMSGVVPENNTNLEVAVAENSPPADESMSVVVPENSMNLEVAVTENSPPAGESTSGGVPENIKKLDVCGSVSVFIKGDSFLKILTGLAAIVGATAMVYAAWKIGDGVDGWKRVGFPIQLKIEKLVILDSLWASRS